MSVLLFYLQIFVHNLLHHYATSFRLVDFVALKFRLLKRSFFLHFYLLFAFEKYYFFKTEVKIIITWVFTSPRIQLDVGRVNIKCEANSWWRTFTGVEPGSCIDCFHCSVKPIPLVIVCVDPGSLCYHP